MSIETEILEAISPPYDTWKEDVKAVRDALWSMSESPQDLSQIHPAARKSCRRGGDFIDELLAKVQTQQDLILKLYRY